MKDLTKGSPLSLILFFAAPILLGNMFQLLYNMADTRIVGTFLGETALAAVGATSSVNNLLVGLIIGFFFSRYVMKKYMKKNPPINEKMIEVMMSSMGRKPSQKQVRQVMNQMNRYM